MQIFKVLLVILASLPWFHSYAVTPQIIHSKMIQNSNKSKEVFTSYWGMEGWAHVSFLVGVDGKPKDIVAIDFSGKERYIKSTFRYVNNLTYSPALVNGVPTISEKSLFVPHTISGLRYSVGSVTPIFSKEYQGAMDMLADTNAEMSKVRVLIDDLKDDHTKNLIEHGLAAWLESAYYFREKDFLEYMRQSFISLELYKYTPVKILVKSSVNLFEGQLHYGYYEEAFKTLDKMRNIQGINLSDETEAQFLAKLENKLNSNEPKKVIGKLSPLGGWIYQNKLQKFGFTNVMGNIESVEIRCIGYRHKYLDDWQTPITIPSYAQQCVTLVQGYKGTTFELIQLVDEVTEPV